MGAAEDDPVDCRGGWSGWPRIVRLSLLATETGSLDQNLIYPKGNGEEGEKQDLELHSLYS